MSDERSSETTQSGIHDRSRFARTLTAIVEHARWANAIRKQDLRFGDRVIVRTRNSVYELWAQGGDAFTVTGGWFDKNHDGPVTVSVNGCTYGGSMIRHDVVAAAGLFLEFGNSVSTTRIRDVELIRWDGEQAEELPC